MLWLRKDSCHLVVPIVVASQGGQEYKQLPRGCQRPPTPPTPSAKGPPSTWPAAYAHTLLWCALQQGSFNVPRTSTTTQMFYNTAPYCSLYDRSSAITTPARACW